MNDDGGRDACAQRVNVDRVVAQALHATGRESGLLAAVVALRIDRFEVYRDTFGPGVGQAIIAATADRIRRSVEILDAVVPCGTSLFVILRGLAHVEDAARRAGSILQVVTEPLRLANVPELRPVANAGFCVYPSDGRSASELIEFARVALDRAMQRGRNQLERYRANG